jgi:RNA polymerase sigma-70 factor (ECF subfamily)
MSHQEQQFKTWHDEYRPRLLHSMTALVKDREAAEDITSAALATAFEKMNQFRGDAAFGTWLHRIALNEAYNGLRRKRAVSLNDLGATSSAWSEPDRMSEVLESCELRQKLGQALQELPRVYRQTLTDHFVRGYSIRKVAQRSRVPLGTVLSRIHTGKRLLRSAWDRVGHIVER